MSSATASKCSAKRVRPADIRRDESSYVDPHGFLFHYQENIYRQLSADAATRYRAWQADGTLARLEGDFSLIPARPAALDLEGHAEGFVVEHPRVWPLTYCNEWCSSMLREAARITLELAIELAGRDMVLQDAYPWNVLFDGTRAMFVDWTSLVPADNEVLWPAHEQFEEFFFRPLLLSKLGFGAVARNLLLDNINGIGHEQFFRMLPLSYRLCHPGTLLTYWLHRRLQRSQSLKNRVRALAANASRHITPAVRRRFLESLMAKVNRLKTRRRGDPWADYYAQIGPHVEKREKLKQIGRFVQQLQPPTVLDLGCNTGVFSLEAARQGARVVSIDSSESCIERLYQTARREKLPITPLVADVLCPTPASGFLSCQYDGLYDRVAADAVFCLGLMHHLHLTGRQSFDRITRLLSKVARRHLIFEYVGPDDENIDHLPQRRNIDYSLETVTEALRAAFPRIDVHTSDRPSRKLLLCSK